MNQLSIFNPDPKQVRFDNYHNANPEIWKQFKDRTFQLIKAGVKHFSADAILHTIRFNTAIRGTGHFKIDNNYSSYYSRLFTANFPEHKTFFEQRKLKSK